MSHLGYLGQVTHHAEDQYGPLDVVEEKGGQLRSLHFGTSARQSTMFVDRPDELALEYTRCMLTALLFMESPPARALMLGLGGGSMVKFLLRRCAACHVDVAELRPAVVEVAQRFFAVPKMHDHLRVHIGDGNVYVQDASVPWDLVLLDLHTSDGMSPVMFDPEFLPACRRLTAAGGVLAANLWYGIDKVVERRVRQLLESCFEQILYLPVAGKRNCIALGIPRRQLPTWSQIESRAADWQERAGLPLPELLPDLARRNPLR
ncbi:MAG TPA: spermidine synthase [Candidatus Latescibacteria bacterium]|nr:spermidine synthase [Gemmatimonadaceae bacterium]MDP6015078.1 spermidine synthase [Candidatus Latescibacterota bacterium]HJP33433.1 spermidine synthase [Candidatus Latescibacterota bacterium]